MQNKDCMEQIVAAFFLVLPVMIAGIVQIICLKKNWLRILKIPLDGSRSFRGKRIFGGNKTWFGVVIMSLVSSATGSLLWQFSSLLRSWVNMSSLVSAIGGFMVIGLAYSLGELPNSFIKRQLNISPGELPKDSKMIFLYKFVDLIDGVALAGITYVVFFSVPKKTVVLAVILGVLIHWLVHKAMVRLNLKSA